MLAPESVLAWIIIGAIAGWLAGLLVKGYGFGLIGNIVIGILGAGIAGILAPALGLYTQSTGGNIVAATVGALILLFLIGLVHASGTRVRGLCFLPKGGLPVGDTMLAVSDQSERVVQRVTRPRRRSELVANTRYSR
jgi:uncharacterized membrane protein YeaQ/YmgE (transglycosylase-associated protein family)